jgi:predicted transcriptional regulator
MTTIEDAVLAYINAHPEGADDDEIAAALGKTRQQVNQRTRQLARDGRITRTPQKKILNLPKDR